MSDQEKESSPYAEVPSNKEHKEPSRSTQPKKKSVPKRVRFRQLSPYLQRYKQNSAKDKMKELQTYKKSEMYDSLREELRRLRVRVLLMAIESFILMQEEEVTDTHEVGVFIEELKHRMKKFKNPIYKTLGRKLLKDLEDLIEE